MRLISTPIKSEKKLYRHPVYLITQNMEFALSISEIRSLILNYCTTNEVDSVRLTNKTLYRSLELYYLRMVLKTVCSHKIKGVFNMRLVSYKYYTDENGRTRALETLHNKPTQKKCRIPPDDLRCTALTKNGEQCKKTQYNMTLSVCKIHSPLEVKRRTYIPRLGLGCSLQDVL